MTCRVRRRNDRAEHNGGGWARDRKFKPLDLSEVQGAADIALTSPWDFASAAAFASASRAALACLIFSARFILRAIIDELGYAPAGADGDRTVVRGLQPSMYRRTC